MQLNSFIEQLFSKPLTILFIVYCGVSFYLYQSLGIKVVNDSERYLTYADKLQSGFYFDAHNFWYFTYSLFIYFIQLFSKNLLWIIVAQYLLCFLSILALYQTYLCLFSDKRGALITALVYIFFIEIISWNSYILCESLFCSLTCFSFYTLTKIKKTTNSLFSIFFTALIIVLTALSKPSGIALIGAIAFTIIRLKWHVIPSKKLKVGLAIILPLTFLILVNQMLTTFMLIENYRTGDIIYAASTLPHLSSHNWLVIIPPDTLFIPSVNLPPLIRLTSFIVHNFWFWLQLFISKIAYFIFHIRPYWSLKHNIYITCILIPLYYFAFLSFLKQSLSHSVLVFSITYILLHVIIVGVTSVDWDGRFLMPIIPLIFVLGIASLRKHLE